MPKLKDMNVLLEQEIKDLYHAENQLVRALPKMAKAASNPSLVEAFNTHLAQTKVHIQRLEKIASMLDITPKGKICRAMQGLVEEGSEFVNETGDPATIDLGLIGAAQRVEHYEISAYGTARALAEALNQSEIAKLLKTTENEEGDTDHLLTDIAMRIMPSAAMHHA